MIDLTLDDLLDQLEQARQIAIEDRKPTAMIQATATMAKLIGMDKPVIKDVNANDVQTLSDLMTELDDARLTAKANGQASAMVTATMSKANLMGLDKGVTVDNEPQPVSIMINMVDARKPERLAEINANGG